MKVQCPECREIVGLEEFSTSEAGLRFRCPECDRINFIPNRRSLAAEADPGGDSPPPGKPALAAASPTPPGPEARLCPKCGHTQPFGDACNRCGLNFLRFDPANLPSDPPEAAELWEQIQHRPQDLELHERFLEACYRAGRLDHATRQYRVLGRDPRSSEVVLQMRARIVSLAQAQLAPAGLVGDDREAAKRRSRIVMWVVMILALGGFALLVYYSSDMLKKIY